MATGDDRPAPDEHPEEVEGSLEALERMGRAEPRKPGPDTEKAIALELARLAGVSPRLLMRPEPPAPSKAPPLAEGAAGEEDDAETGDDPTA